MNPARNDVGATELSSRASQSVAAAVIVGAVWLAFRGTLQNQFVEWDDQIAIVTNPHIREFNAQNVRWMFSTFHLGPYQPLAWLSLAADHALWGLNPRGFHLTSLVFHAANAVLVFVVTLMLLGTRRSAARTERAARADVVAALCGTLFYAIHPQRVESVAWATERRDLLSGLFGLLTIICWLARARRLRAAAPDFARAGDGRSRTFYALSLCAFCLALLSKATVVGIPLVLLILDALCLRRVPMNPRSWWAPHHRYVVADKIPFVVAAILAAATALFGQHEAEAIRSVEETGFARPISVAAYATAFYLVKMLAPVDLSPLYEAPPELSGIAIYVLSAAALLLLTTLAAIRWASRRPAILATWLAYLALIAPVCGIVPIGSHLAADRYTYLANIPWAILAAAGVASLLAEIHAIPRRWFPVKTAAIAVTAAALLATLGALTSRQVRVWSGSYSLWDHVIAINPRSAIAHYGRAVALWRVGREDAAIVDYREAIRLKPDYSDAHNNLGAIFAARGDLKQAESHFLAAEAARAENPVAQFNLGIVAGKEGRVADAERYYRSALRIRPEMLSARLNLAQLLVARGDVAAGRELLRDGLTLAPSDSTLAAAIRAIIPAESTAHNRTR